MSKNIDNFNEWLQKQLSKPISSHYDANGNSIRAVTTRGLIKEICYQFNRYPKDLKYEIKSFRGFDTPIGYFINLFLMIILAPIVPIIRSIFSYKEAIKEYKRMFENDIKKQNKEELGND